LRLSDSPLREDFLACRFSFATQVPGTFRTFNLKCGAETPLCCSGPFSLGFDPRRPQPLRLKTPAPPLLIRPVAWVLPFPTQYPRHYCGPSPAPWPLDRSGISVTDESLLGQVERYPGRAPTRRGVLTREPLMTFHGGFLVRPVFAVCQRCRNRISKRIPV